MSDTADPQTDPDTQPAPDQGDDMLSIDRSRLRDALRQHPDLRARDVMRALSEAGGPEAAIVALVDKIAQQGKAAGSVTVRPTARRAFVQFRHIVVVVSFLICVGLPLAVAGWYLASKTTPQYASSTSFTVRQENHSSPTEMLSTFGLSTGQTSDTDVLYDFIQSQDLVAAISRYRDLETIWSRPGYDNDPVFAYKPGGSIEDLTAYWNRMVSISYDTSAMILEVQVLAFTPEEARMIAGDILDESTQIINELSSIARRDVLRYAQEDLTEAESRLRDAREALTVFRNRYQIASIQDDIALATAPLNALTQQLVEARIEFGLLVRSTTENDPRRRSIDATISVIEDLIVSERAKLGGDGTDPVGGVLATRITEFEQLSVDLVFAETIYSEALAAFYAARAEANRQSRYLAAHKNPTLAERSDYPMKGRLLAIIGGFAFLFWAILALTVLSLRDRR